MQNWPTEQEIESLARQYWELLQQKEGNSEAQWDMSNPDCAGAVKQVK